ncbi:MAG TPA: hypothetical protein VH249_23020 [Xanthobacteraceae bacterium]|jgi:hypothetical protein|nr:hypothetical protein [Xanthobacteraceae bacterium]
MTRLMTMNTLWRAALLAGTAALAACSASVPDFTQLKLPNPRQLLPSNSDTYVAPASARAFKPIGPQDLVDGQGLCPGMATGAEIASGSDAAAAAAPAPPAVPGAVGLDMSECDVVRAAGQPQTVNVGTNDRGERRVVMTYANSERAGTYEFVSGRLTSLERGPEPPPPAKPEKPAKKKPASAGQQTKKQPAT